jgi:hypothetical protein
MIKALFTHVVFCASVEDVFVRRASLIPPASRASLNNDFVRRASVSSAKASDDSSGTDGYVRREKKHHDGVSTLTVESTGLISSINVAESLRAQAAQASAEKAAAEKAAAEKAAAEKAAAGKEAKRSSLYEEIDEERGRIKKERLIGNNGQGTCDCQATLYQHWVEGYPRNQNDQPLNDEAACNGAGLESSGYCSTGVTQSFSTTGLAAGTSTIIEHVNASVPGSSLNAHVSSIKVTGSSHCAVRAYKYCSGAPYNTLATTFTQSSNTFDRKYEPGVVTPGGNLQAVLGWQNDQVRCIEFECQSPTPTPPPAPLPEACSCDVTLYQHWVEGYPKDEHGNQVVPASKDICNGVDQFDSTTSSCSTGVTQHFSTTGLSPGSMSPEKLRVNASVAGSSLSDHVSSIKITGNSQHCAVHAYKYCGANAKPYNRQVSTFTHPADTASRSYQPGVVTPGGNLKAVLGWQNDQVRCIKFECRVAQCGDQDGAGVGKSAVQCPDGYFAKSNVSATPCADAVACDTTTPTSPDTDKCCDAPPTPTPPPAPLPPPPAPIPEEPTPSPTEFLNMTRVCSVYDCPWWCLDACHGFDKTYINSRAASLQENSKKTCTPAIANLFRTFLCREPEPRACTYLAGHRGGANVTKVEVALKGSSEYANCKICTRGCK